MPPRSVARSFRWEGHSITRLTCQSNQKEKQSQARTPPVCGHSLDERLDYKNLPLRVLANDSGRLTGNPEVEIARLRLYFRIADDAPGNFVRRRPHSKVGVKTQPKLATVRGVSEKPQR